MDFTASNHGSIIALTAQTQAGLDWIAENLVLEPWQRSLRGRFVAIEPRYFDDIVEGIRADGLTID